VGQGRGVVVLVTIFQSSSLITTQHSAAVSANKLTKIDDALAQLLELGRGCPYEHVPSPRVLPCQFWSFYVEKYERITEIIWNKLMLASPVVHSEHGPISYFFEISLDKMQNFITPVYLTHLLGVPLRFCDGVRARKKT